MQVILDVNVLQILYTAINLRLVELDGFALDAVLILIALLTATLCIYNKQLTRFEGFTEDATDIWNLERLAGKSLVNGISEIFIVILIKLSSDLLLHEFFDVCDGCVFSRRCFAISIHFINLGSVIGKQILIALQRRDLEPKRLKRILVELLSFESSLSLRLQQDRLAKVLVVVLWLLC